MDEIKKKANELGLLIKHTQVYNDFARLTAEIADDEDAFSLLKKYNEVAEILQEKNESGTGVEKYEKEMFKALTETIRENRLIIEYLKARDAYMELLMQIHNSIGGSL